MFGLTANAIGVLVRSTEEVWYGHQQWSHASQQSAAPNKSRPVDSAPEEAHKNDQNRVAHLQRQTRVWALPWQHIQLKHLCASSCTAHCQNTHTHKLTEDKIMAEEWMMKMRLASKTSRGTNWLHWTQPGGRTSCCWDRIVSQWWRWSSSCSPTPTAGPAAADCDRAQRTAEAKTKITEDFFLISRWQVSHNSGRGVPQASVYLGLGLYYECLCEKLIVCINVYSVQIVDQFDLFNSVLFSF